MNVPMFLVWGVWDGILVITATGFVWLVLERFGATNRNAVGTGTALWIMIFVVLWLALVNMNVAPIGIALATLPLAWLEMVVAALAVLWATGRERT